MIQHKIKVEKYEKPLKRKKYFKIVNDVDEETVNIIKMLNIIFSQPENVGIFDIIDLEEKYNNSKLMDTLFHIVKYFIPSKINFGNSFVLSHSVIEDEKLVSNEIVFKY